MFERIARIRKTYRHILRYREILGIIAKYGFSDFLSRIQIRKHFDIGKKPLPSLVDEEIIDLSVWERIRMILEELGPSFIKLGQVMSTRPDMLPPELIIELEKLQHEVPPFPSEDARDVVENELGKPIHEIFQFFDDTPVASASIAQTHKGVLLTGEKVAIKIQRPKIKQKIKLDIDIMYHLSTLLERYVEEAEHLDLRGIIKEFSSTIFRELNFRMEAANIVRFRNNFRDDDRLYVPEVYEEFSDEKVIVMEFIDAIPFTQKKMFTQFGIDPKEIARIGSDISLKQIFDFGFFHADPHPGNIFVKDKKVIVLLDFGMVGFLSQSHRELLGDLLIGTIMNDVTKVCRTLIKMSGKPYLNNYQAYEADIDHLIMQYAYLPLKNIEVGPLLQKMMDILVAHNLRLNPNYYLLIKAMITVEGVTLDLDPDYNLMEHIKPYAKKIVRSRLNPKRLAKNIYLSSVDLAVLLKNLPSEIQDIIQMTKEGKIKIEFEHKNIAPMIQEIDESSNRLVFAIVLASLIVGSSIVIHSNIPPKWNEIPIIGIIGYIFAGLIGFWLIISILKHKRMGD